MDYRIVNKIMCSLSVVSLKGSEKRHFKDMSTKCPETMDRACLRQR